VQVHDGSEARPSKTEQEKGGPLLWTGGALIPL